MKYLIPVLVGGAAITAAITTAIAQGHGALNGHALLMPPYVYGYGAAAVLLVIASVLAVNAHRQEENRDAATGRNPLPLPVTVHQENKQEFNPRLEFNPTIQIGASADTALAAQEKLSHENLILVSMREQHQKKPPGQRSLIYHIEGIASATHLTMEKAREALESLYLKKLIYRSTVGDGRHFIYWLNSD